MINFFKQLGFLILLIPSIIILTNSCNSLKNNDKTFLNPEGLLYPIPKSEIIQRNMKQQIIVFNSDTHDKFIPVDSEFVNIDTAVISLKYDFVGCFVGGVAPVVFDRKWGYCNYYGYEVVPLKYQHVSLFSEGYSKVKYKDKYGFVDKEGNEVTDIIYENANSYCEGMAAVRLNSKWGFINIFQDMEVPAIYDDVTDFSFGYSSVKKNNKWGLINKYNKLIFPFIYQDPLIFREGLAAVAISGKYGYINIENEIVIPPIFEKAFSFNGFLASVIFKGKLEKISKDGFVFSNFNPKIQTNSKINRNQQKAIDQIKKSMVFIPEGFFTMGCDSLNDDCHENSIPSHNEFVNDFYMCKYEVTQFQWESIMGYNPSYHKNCYDCPVENISWSDIQIFLDRLNKLTGENYNLPSEIQWEYVARTGNKNKKDIISADKRSWNVTNSRCKSHKVGLKKSNSFGLYDMNGNVSEITRSEALPYSGPIGSYVIWQLSNAKFGYITRDGNFLSNRPSFFNTMRYGLGKNNSEIYTGFRLSK